ncbi:MAG: hypothetical protein AAFZ58_06215 [Pseudomonadota bacterium]
MQERGTPGLFGLRGVRIVHIDQFWLELERLDHSVFDAIDDDYGVDIDLMLAVSDCLEPHLGDADESTGWWQNDQYYGNGIRSLSINEPDFDPRYLNALQALLKGRFAPRIIVVHMYEDIYADDCPDEPKGAVALFSDSTLITNVLAKKLALVTSVP